MTKVTFPRIRIWQKRILTIWRISNLPKMYEVRTLSNFITSLVIDRCRIILLPYSRFNKMNDQWKMVQSSRVPLKRKRVWTLGKQRTHLRWSAVRNHSACHRRRSFHHFRRRSDQVTARGDSTTLAQWTRCRISWSTTTQRSTIAPHNNCLLYTSPSPRD